MNNDNQIKHHLYWILRDMGRIKPEEYADFMGKPLSQEVCEEVDKLVSHIKTNY